jgi:nucleotide-binding universal stress UspA family protein
LFHCGTNIPPSGAALFNLKHPGLAGSQVPQQKLHYLEVLSEASEMARRLLPQCRNNTMERILVGTSPRRGAFSALTRAISLAKRIQAKVHVLFVAPPPEGNAPGAASLAEPDDRRRLRLMVRQASEEGVGIEYFVAEGNYEEEVIRFAREHRITLLVWEATDGDGGPSERGSQSLRQILHGIACRVELVSPRKDETATQGKGEAT